MRSSTGPRRGSLAAVTLLAFATLVISAVPALATPAPGSPASFGVRHPQEDYAGSQIAVHEGTGGAIGTQDVSGPLGMDVSGHHVFYKLHDGQP